MMEGEMSKKVSIVTTAVGVTFGLIQAAAVWGITSSFLTGLCAFGAGILPTAAAGWSPYLLERLKVKAVGLADEDEG
jgi:hypothetical protein